MRAFLILMLVTGSLASATAAVCAQDIRFQEYKARVEKVRASRIDLRSNPDAASFRTRLNDGLKRGTNFAGHYAIVTWGCGTGCFSGAFIDTRTGRVYSPIEFNSIATLVENGDYADKPIEYRANSRLLILRGAPGKSDNDDAPEHPPGIYYYEWKNNKLRQLKFVPKPPQ